MLIYYIVHFHANFPLGSAQQNTPTTGLFFTTP